MKSIQEIKSMKGKQKIVMLTAYDFPTANLMDGIVDVFLVGDMPIGTYNNEKDALKNAKLFLEAGAHAVKIERKPEIAKFLVKNGIQVMGHTGLTPQTITTFKVQGKDNDSADKILNEAIELDKAGCFSLVLECIPLSFAKTITEKIKIPTIGIGAGIHCDGQVLVTNDIL